MIRIRLGTFLVALLPALMLAGLGGCCCICPPKQVFVTPPPPLSLDEQLYAAGARARAVPMLRADGSIRIVWTDEKGKHDERTDAALYLKQRYDAEGLQNGGGDVALFGRVVGKEFFQAGRNPQKFWFLVRHDVNTIWIGDSAPPPATGGTSEPARPVVRSPLRADLLIDLLGLTQIGFDPRQTVLQRYNESRTAPAVDLLVLMPAPSGRRYLQRAITIDRMTGYVTGVTIYDFDGLPLVSSELGDYRDAPYRDGDKYEPKAPAKLPYKVTIRYARQDTTVELKFEDVSIPATLPPKVFNTPNYQEQGLKVVLIEQDRLR